MTISNPFSSDFHFKQLNKSYLIAISNFTHSNDAPLNVVVRPIENIRTVFCHNVFLEILVNSFN